MKVYMIKLRVEIETGDNDVADETLHKLTREIAGIRRVGGVGVKARQTDASGPYDAEESAYIN